MGGCRGERRTSPDTAPSSVSAGSPSTVASTDADVTPRDAYDALPDGPEPLPAAFRAKPIRGKAVGHTSVVFKLELTSGVKAAFKPASRRAPLRYRGEIAAYRLAHALGLETVPAAYPAVLRTSDLAACMSPGSDGARLVAEELLPTASGVEGALIPWLDDLAFVAFEREPLWSAWRSWLRGEKPKLPPGAPPELSSLDGVSLEVLAADLSALVLFDAVTGNWDRWSGGNVGWSKTARRLVLVDNDGAFFAKPPADAVARNRRYLEATRRFPRRLVAALRALASEAASRRVFGGAPDGSPLLDDVALRGVVSRAAEALALIDAKIARDGDATTLAFP